MWKVCLAFIFDNVAQIDKRPTTDFAAKTSDYQQAISIFWNFSAPFCAFNA